MTLGYCGEKEHKHFHTAKERYFNNHEKTGRGEKLTNWVWYGFANLATEVFFFLSLSLFICDL